MKSTTLPKRPATRYGRIVLVDRGYSHERYATALQCRDTPEGEWDSSWTWGHYFDSLDDARFDFDVRVARGY